MVSITMIAPITAVNSVDCIWHRWYTADGLRFLHTEPLKALKALDEKHLNCTPFIECAKGQACYASCLLTQYEYSFVVAERWQAACTFMSCRF